MGALISVFWMLGLEDFAGALATGFAATLATGFFTATGLDLEAIGFVAGADFFVARGAAFFTSFGAGFLATGFLSAGFTTFFAEEDLAMVCDLP